MFATGIRHVTRSLKRAPVHGFLEFKGFLQKILFEDRFVAHRPGQPKNTVRIGHYWGISAWAMLMNDDDFIPTRHSLLSRLKDYEDQESWRTFFDTYGRLLYRVAAKAGLTD